MRPCLPAPIQIREKRFGGEAGLFCVPLVATTEDELLAQAKIVSPLNPDVVEWRSDFYSDLTKPSISAAAAGLRSVLKDSLLLFTVRAKNEGGNKDLSQAERLTAIETALSSNVFDLVDVELSSGANFIDPVIRAARKAGARVILSFHSFSETPENATLLGIVKAMIDSGTDIVKIACMPQAPDDVLRLLKFTLETRRSFPSIPLCTMSMGGMGCLSRVAGFLYGSDMAFAVGDKVSAPGQIPLQEARQIAMTLLKYA